MVSSPVRGQSRAAVAVRQEVSPRGTFDHRPWYIEHEHRGLWFVYAESGITLAGFPTFLLSHVLLRGPSGSGVDYVSQSAATALRELFSRIAADEAALPPKAAAEFLFYCRVPPIFRSRVYYA